MSKTKRYVPHWADDRDDDYPKQYQKRGKGAARMSKERDRWLRGFDKRRSSGDLDYQTRESHDKWRSRNMKDDDRD
jgi:hypothetical protein